MSVQDRNCDRNAKFILKEISSGPIATIAVNDKDVTEYAMRMRYNFRLTDLFFSCKAVGVAAAVIRACIGKELSAIGAPQFGAAAAVTFTIEAFDQIDAGVFTAVGATAAQAFTGTEVVTDGYWGCWTVQIDGAQAITTKAAAPVMAFATELDAVKNAPKPDASKGLVGVLTINASGANFIAGTTNTNAGTVAAFNTEDRGGHYLNAPILATQSALRGTLVVGLKVAQVGNLIGEAGDYLVLTARSAGNATFSNGIITGVIRRIPAQGEGFELGTGRTEPFLP